jgi:hypothetical protein
MMRRATLKNTTIAAVWDDYRVVVMPPDAPSVQVTECRRAFYAGAQSLLSAILASLSPGDEPAAADEEYLEAVHDELLRFRADLKEGRA